MGNRIGVQKPQRLRVSVSHCIAFYRLAERSNTGDELGAAIGWRAVGNGGDDRAAFSRDGNRLIAAAAIANNDMSHARHRVQSWQQEAQIFGFVANWNHDIDGNRSVISSGLGR